MTLALPTMVRSQTVINPVPVQLNMTHLGTAYTQDFDTLPMSGTPSFTTLPVGWGFQETGSGANSSYATGTGTSLTGDTYDFGNSGSTDRALGTLRSGSVASTIGAKFVNNTGLTLVDAAVAYRGEQWRLGATGRGADQLVFQYSTTAAAIGSNIGNYREVGTLNFSTPNFNLDAASRTDGNMEGYHADLAATLGNLNVANSGTFFLQWVDQIISGANDGLAVDDFSLRITKLGTNGANVTVASLACPAGVTIQNGSATASVLTINTADEQSVAGTLIDGSTGSLGFTKDGASRLTLAGNNTFTGATAVTAGTLVAAAVNGGKALGGTARVTVNNGGTLLFATPNQMNATAPAPVTLGSTTGDGTAILATGAGLGTSSQGTRATAGIGALTLQASATIDLAGTNLLHFAASDTATAGAVLSILDWNGTPVTGGGAEALLFGSGPDGLGFLSQVRFVNPEGYAPGIYAALFASSNDGEIVPGDLVVVPEPTTVLGGLLIVCSALWHRRKRKTLLAPSIYSK